MQTTTDDDHLLDWVAELSERPATDEFTEEPRGYVDRGAEVFWHESGDFSAERMD